LKHEEVEDSKYAIVTQNSKVIMEGKVSFGEMNRIFFCANFVGHIVDNESEFVAISAKVGGEYVCQSFNEAFLHCILPNKESEGTTVSVFDPDDLDSLDI